MKPKKILHTQAPLMNYAGWYALRYMPSYAKLREALMTKSENNIVIVEQVMEQMAWYIHEDSTVESLVRMWLDRGKTESYIRTKLQNKKFDPGIIEETLKIYREQISDWKVYEKNAERKLRTMMERGKSKRFALMTLVGEYGSFWANIQTLIESIYPDEDQTLRREYEKLAQRYGAPDPKNRQKIIQKLLSRGFGYDSIKTCFQEE